jgi:hypothetical protein
LVPTRLGDPQSQLRLARWENGALRPWSNGDDWRAWRLSEVTVMKIYVADAAAPSQDAMLSSAIERARSAWPERHDESLLIPLVPAPDGSAAWVGSAIDGAGRLRALRYDPESGLAIAQPVSGRSP